MANEFKPLVPAAKGHLLRIMSTSDDDKLVANIARDVLVGAEDKAGGAGTQILISNSQVVLLTNTAKELKDYGGSS